ncbi:C-GCAxxG-C-C family protein [Gaoshiqia sediminis]|uniref:C-GCAxxG-C-C family protein n=1 Tax=Gaoshiqia sediminis TaxID=2986998 RepID=A0AA41Y5L8_9BACT|nr:C-GCAxxG-C-C family protein [Gaoshiqia sediminis]MCW0483854.1 C-GCAxxG-C-C family protein [Gaoshiqia sediminis]
MDKSERALACFKNFNCSQSVFSTFAEDFHIDRTTALKLASGFGGGMACAETCGAVTGAYLVIGMKHGHAVPDPEAKAATKAHIRGFNSRFAEIHGSLLCRELLGVNISTPEGQQLARARDVFNRLCPRFIETACKLLEDEF